MLYFTLVVLGLMNLMLCRNSIDLCDSHDSLGRCIRCHFSSFMWNGSCIKYCSETQRNKMKIHSDECQICDLRSDSILNNDCEQCTKYFSIDHIFNPVVIAYFERNICVYVHCDIENCDICDLNRKCIACQSNFFLYENICVKDSTNPCNSK